MTIRGTVVSRGAARRGALIVATWTAAVVTAVAAVGGASSDAGPTTTEYPLCLPIGAVTSSADALAKEGDTKPDPKMFIELGDKPNSVHITVVAAFNMHNGGMNFNVYSRGGATYRVPKGWTVKVTYKNSSAVPHSAMIVDADETDRLQLGDPYWEGASTTNPKRGGTETESFTFTPDETGKFAIACGFPGHCVGGHWLYLIVDKPDSKPSLKLGDEEPYVPTK